MAVIGADRVLVWSHGLIMMPRGYLSALCFPDHTKFCVLMENLWCSPASSWQGNWSYSLSLKAGESKKGLGSVGNIKCSAFEWKPAHCTFQIASKFAQFKEGFFFFTLLSLELNCSLCNFIKSLDTCSVSRTEKFLFVCLLFCMFCNLIKKHLVFDTSLNHMQILVHYHFVGKGPVSEILFSCAAVLNLIIVKRLRRYYLELCQ